MAVESQKVKLARIIDPQAIVNNASFTTQEIDSQDFNYAQIVVYVGATDAAFSTLKIQESATSGSGFVDVQGLVMGSDPNDTGSTSALPTATDDNSFFVFDVDLRGRKRYLDLVATVGSGTAGAFATSWCVLSRGNDVPVTAADRDASQVLRV